MLCAPGLQKVGKNKIVGQQDVWDKNLSIIQTKYIIKAVKNVKNDQMRKRTVDIVVSVAAAV